MANPQTNVDPTNTTNEEEISQSLMKIQNTNLRLLPTVDQYLEQLRMLIQTLNNVVLSTVLSYSFVVPMSLISLAGSTTVFNKTTKVVQFQLTNSKMRSLRGSTLYKS
ncbi:unnamed protein product [Lactuca saligna]|uniref:Uncharacterized protein n=1 Tax=Lactuca saligna TaxID=75948 RepID=A0AA35VMU9_LACSI|nr:unnamed protein product [Lactuca saligna]